MNKSVYMNFSIEEADLIGKINRMLGNFKTSKEDKKVKDNWNQIMKEYGDLIKFASKKDKKQRYKVIRKILNRAQEPSNSKNYFFIHKSNMKKLADWYFKGEI